MNKKFNFITLLTCLLVSNIVNATESPDNLPELVSAEWNNTTQIGQTKFSRFGIHIYDASFWSLTDYIGTEKTNKATALSIQYARNIKAEKLLSNTYKQWKRLGFLDKYPVNQWLTELKNIWPNVKPGDRLIFVSNKDGINRFYSNDKKLGSINDTRFSSAFLDIWLSPNAKFQKHRKELLGETL